MTAWRGAARILCLLFVFASLSSTGCVGLLAHVLYFAKGGDRAPAEYDDLADHRVAVVVVSSESAFGPDKDTRLLARGIERTLLTEVSKLELVPQEEIDDWIDRNEWDGLDYREIGRGVQAERVVVVNVANLRLHEGATLLKGRADVSVLVYDMTIGKGKKVYYSERRHFSFPESGARAAENEDRFRRLFLHNLAHFVAKRFYEYELLQDVAIDASHLSG